MEKKETQIQRPHSKGLSFYRDKRYLREELGLQGLSFIVFCNAYSGGRLGDVQPE
jgi:hypothetical protein